MSSATQASLAQQKNWLAQWRRAAVALEEQERDELELLTDEEALKATEALLALSSVTSLDPGRTETSGLVELQALLHKRSVLR